MLRPRFVRPTLSTLLGQLLPLHLSRPELQLFIASELKNFVIPARKEQTDWSFRIRFSLHCWQFCFSSGKMHEWVKPGRECGGHFFCRSFARALLAASPLIYAREETTSYINYTSIYISFITSSYSCW